MSFSISVFSHHHRKVVVFLFICLLWGGDYTADFAFLLWLFEELLDFITFMLFCFVQWIFDLQYVDSVATRNGYVKWHSHLIALHPSTSLSRWFVPMKRFHDKKLVCVNKSASINLCRNWFNFRLFSHCLWGSTNLTRMCLGMQTK